MPHFYYFKLLYSSPPKSTIFFYTIDDIHMSDIKSVFIFSVTKFFKI